MSVVEYKGIETASRHKKIITPIFLKIIGLHTFIPPAFFEIEETDGRYDAIFLLELLKG